MAAALGLAACGSSGGSTSSSSDPNAMASVNVGIALSPPKAIFLGPYVAQQEGFFKKEHLNVKFISMPNGLQTELGATAGSIDFGFSSGTDSIEAAAQHAPIHAIWSYGTKLDTQCIGAPGINTAKGLIGQPVGSTGTDGFSITLLQACLEPAGVHLSQVKQVDMVRSRVRAGHGGQEDRRGRVPRGRRVRDHPSAQGRVGLVVGVQDPPELVVRRGQHAGQVRPGASRRSWSAS